jgi:hypothetical protein
MKSLHKLIIAIYFAIWSFVFYYLLGYFVHFQTLTGNTSEDLLKVYLSSSGIYNWLYLLMSVVFVHLVAYAIILIIKVVSDLKVEKVKASMEK